MAPAPTTTGAAAGTGSSSIAARWRELQGEDSWKGLLDPVVDIDLRRSIISYGELVQATGYGFNADTGGCLYGYSDLLTKTGAVAAAAAAAGHYRVTKFVYATEKLPPPSISVGESDWIGYVAVATDEGVAALGRRDIVVAWRGTMTDIERHKDFDESFAAMEHPDDVLGGKDKFTDARVHEGFLSLYTSNGGGGSNNKLSARDHVLEEVSRLVEMYKDEAEVSITVAGHSLGASLAVLNALDIVANAVNVVVAPSSSNNRPPCPVTAIVLSCPGVGNEAFKQAFESFHGKGLRALHVKNDIDIVPRLLEMLGYVHVGVTLPINTALSPYIKEPKDLMDPKSWGHAHNLESYLHGVAGVGVPFKLVVHRNVALLNRDMDVLEEKYGPVPPFWGTELLNKFMVINTPGKWELKHFE